MTKKEIALLKSLAKELNYHFGPPFLEVDHLMAEFDEENGIFNLSIGRRDIGFTIENGLIDVVNSGTMIG